MCTVCVAQNFRTSVLTAHIQVSGLLHLSQELPTVENSEKSVQTVNRPHSHDNLFRTLSVLFASLTLLTYALNSNIVDLFL